MNQRTEKHYVGIDVCKTKLDVSCPAFPGNGHEVFANTTAGMRALFEKLATLDAPAHLIVEPTGGYERLLLETAFARQTALSRVDALRVRRFAQARGSLAKTDKVDAEVLSAFGLAFSPVEALALSDEQKALAAVARRRERLVAARTREKNALEKASDPFVIKDIRASLAFLERHIASCEKQLDTIIRADQVMTSKRRRLESVKGVARRPPHFLLPRCPNSAWRLTPGFARSLGWHRSTTIADPSAANARFMAGVPTSAADSTCP